MREKMEFTVAEIDNFMDPNSIKARTEVPFLKSVASALEIRRSTLDAKV